MVVYFKELDMVKTYVLVHLCIKQSPFAQSKWCTNWLKAEMLISLMSHRSPPVGCYETPLLSIAVTICYVMWFVITLYEFDVTLCWFVFHYLTLLLRYMNWPLRFVHLSIRYVGLCFTNAALILQYLICSLRFVHFLILLWTFHFFMSLWLVDAVYVGKARLRHVTTLCFFLCFFFFFFFFFFCLFFIITLCTKQYITKQFPTKKKKETRGPRATIRSPEWHSHCRHADVMQHLSNPIIATNENIIIWAVLSFEEEYMGLTVNGAWSWINYQSHFNRRINVKFRGNWLSGFWRIVILYM